MLTNKYTLHGFRIADLRARPTMKSDAAGNVGTIDGVHVYGPYLRGGFRPLPVGPNHGATRVRMRDNTPLTG